MFQPLLRENTPSLPRLDHYMGVKLETYSVFKGILGWGRGALLLLCLHRDNKFRNETAALKQMGLLQEDLHILLFISLQVGGSTYVCS